MSGSHIQRNTITASIKERLRSWGRRIDEVWSSIHLADLKEIARRWAGHAAMLAVIAVGIWVARQGVGGLPTIEAPQAGEPAEVAQPTTAPGTEVSLQDLGAFAGGGAISGSISRLADVHTIIPDRPRIEVIKYTVKGGDSLFGIASKHGLKPSTILWGNWYELSGDPHTLQPGQKLNILPVDGALHVWSAGESLSGVARFFGVEPQAIIDWPGNELDPNTDFQSPGIEAGVALVVPGGVREVPDWRTPRITRTNPARARQLGPGHCGKVYSGPIGTGAFIWPTATKRVSGYRYEPGVHEAIDIGGRTGHAIFASDSGVVVYAGWSNWGYGNMVVLDHGNGWQTLYAHLSRVLVSCGQGVNRGYVIGSMGSTGNSSGPHLHFEMRHDKYGRVNPLKFLP